MLNAGQTALRYHKMYLLPTTDNTSSCSAIAYGQNALTGSEKLSFYISNYTTSKQPITVTPRMYALRDLMVFAWIFGAANPLEMKRGDSTESTPYTVTSWEAGPSCRSIYHLCRDN